MAFRRVYNQYQKKPADESKITVTKIQYNFDNADLSGTLDDKYVAEIASKNCELKFLDTQDDYLNSSCFEETLKKNGDVNRPAFIDYLKSDPQNAPLIESLEKIDLTQSFEDVRNEPIIASDPALVDRLNQTYLQFYGKYEKFDYMEGYDFNKPFNKNDPIIKQIIHDTINEYKTNYLELPKDFVTITVDDPKNITNDIIKDKIKEKYGYDVASFSKYYTAQKLNFAQEKAFEKLGEMFETKDYSDYINIRARLQHYSANNIALIYSQKPNAEVVMGYHAWGDYDRHIVAGEKGIEIIQPKNRILKTERQVDNYIAKEYSDPNGSHAVARKEQLMKEIEDNGETSIRDGFTSGYVFDVSQTMCNDPEHDLFQEFLDRDKPLNKDLSNYAQVVDALKKTSELTLNQGDKAVISVPSNDGTSEQDKIYDAVLKYAEQVFSQSPESITGIKSTIPSKGDMHKIETVMTAQLICKHLGIECDEKTNVILATALEKKPTEQMLTIGRRQMFMQGFDRACRLSDTVTKEFDKEMGCDLETQKQAIADKIKALKESKSDNSNKDSQAKPTVKHSKSTPDLGLD